MTIHWRKLKGFAKHPSYLTFEGATRNYFVISSEKYASFRHSTRTETISGILNCPARFRPAQQESNGRSGNRTTGNKASSLGSAAASESLLESLPKPEPYSCTMFVHGLTKMKASRMMPAPEAECFQE